jgi:hypothetical protein
VNSANDAETICEAAEAVFWGGDAHLLIKIKTNLYDSGSCEAND